MARAARCLPLLPSGPGGVHRATLRETRSSAPREPSGAHSTRNYTNAKLIRHRRRHLITDHPHWSAWGGLSVVHLKVRGRCPCRPSLSPRQAGGEAGIRTRGGVSPTHALQACSFSHSDTSPLNAPNAKLRVCERISETSPSAYFSHGKSSGCSRARNPATISSHTLSTRST